MIKCLADGTMGKDILFLEEVFEVICGFYQDVYKKVTEINFREFSIFINFKHHGYINNGMTHIKLKGENQTLFDLKSYRHKKSGTCTVPLLKYFVAIKLISFYRPAFG